LKELVETEEDDQPRTVNSEQVQNVNNPSSSSRATVQQELRELSTYFGFDFKPIVSGEIGYDIKKPLRGFKFEVTGAAKEILLGGLAVDGLFRLQKGEPIKIETGLEGISAPRIEFFVGPVPVWIDFPLLLYFKPNIRLDVSYERGVLGQLQTGYGKFTVDYDASRSRNDRWRTNSRNASLTATVFCGRSNLSGTARAGIEPSVQALLYSVYGPELGIERNNEHWSQGLIGYPEQGSVDRRASREDPAGHSVLLVGYNDEESITVESKMEDGSTQTFTYKGVYYFKNSWGTGSFGTQTTIEGRVLPGYGKITQKYSHDFGGFYAWNWKKLPRE
jgi:hypothetical protein